MQTSELKSNTCLKYPRLRVDINRCYIGIRCFPVAHFKAEFQVLGDVPNDVAEEELVSYGACRSQAGRDRFV
jgi:hypothetical protein